VDAVDRGNAGIRTQARLFNCLLSLSGCAARTLATHQCASTIDGQTGGVATFALIRRASLRGRQGEATMKICKTFLTAAMIAASGPAMAQATNPTVVNPSTGLQTPLTFTTTTCMMNCNSQVASCQTRCYVSIPSAPLPSPSLAPPPILNATANTACIMGCTSTQLACQSGCALNAPSR
jgi:hypothetical protein